METWCLFYEAGSVLEALHSIALSKQHLPEWSQISLDKNVTRFWASRGPGTVTWQANCQYVWVMIYRYWPDRPCCGSLQGYAIILSLIELPTWARDNVVQRLSNIFTDDLQPVTRQVSLLRSYLSLRSMSTHDLQGDGTVTPKSSLITRPHLSSSQWWPQTPPSFPILHTILHHYRLHSIPELCWQILKHRLFFRWWKRA